MNLTIMMMMYHGSGAVVVIIITIIITIRISAAGRINLSDIIIVVSSNSSIGLLQHRAQTSKSCVCPTHRAQVHLGVYAQWPVALLDPVRLHECMHVHVEICVRVATSACVYVYALVWWMFCCGHGFRIYCHPH